jgi:hypothetical protein
MKRIFQKFYLFLENENIAMVFDSLYEPIFCDWMGIDDLE